MVSTSSVLLHVRETLKTGFVLDVFRKVTRKCVNLLLIQKGAKVSRFCLHAAN